MPWHTLFANVFLDLKLNHTPWSLSNKRYTDSNLQNCLSLILGLFQRWQNLLSNFQLRVLEMDSIPGPLDKCFGIFDKNTNLSWFLLPMIESLHLGCLVLMRSSSILPWHHSSSRPRALVALCFPLIRFRQPSFAASFSEIGFTTSWPSFSLIATKHGMPILNGKAVSSLTFVGT